MTGNCIEKNLALSSIKTKTGIKKKKPNHKYIAVSKPLAAQEWRSNKLQPSRSKVDADH